MPTEPTKKWLVEKNSWRGPGSRFWRVRDPPRPRAAPAPGDDLCPGDPRTGVAARHIEPAGGLRDPGRDVVIVNAPDFLFFVGYDAPLRYLEDRPAHLRALATGLVPLTVSRPDVRTLRIDSEIGFPAGLADPVYRGPTAPLRPGDSIAFPGRTVEIRAAGEDGRARSADFRFAAPFESLVWLRWDGGVYRPFQPPRVGETMTLPPAHLPF